jgi:hypothetical protein
LIGGRYSLDRHSPKEQTQQGASIDGKFGEPCRGGIAPFPLKQVYYVMNARDSQIPREIIGYVTMISVYGCLFA